MSKRDDDEYTWDDNDEVVEIEVSKPLQKVVPVRLASDKWELLRHEAQELGIGPTTLVRMWVLEKLRSVHHEPTKQKTRRTNKSKPATSKQVPSHQPATRGRIARSR